VLITGWNRPEEFACTKEGSRRRGVSFVVDPLDLTPASTVNFTYLVQPIDEKPRSTQDGIRSMDVLYCSGHTHLSSGKVLFVGGAYYQNLSRPGEKEFGLNYARVFIPVNDASGGYFERIDHNLTIGDSWYPTVANLPDGRVLVAGGFFACCGDSVVNSQLAIFDPVLYEQGSNPWSVLADLQTTRNDTAPGIKDYTRLWVLKKPVIAANGVRYDVAAMGWRGKLVLLNTDASTPAAQRWFDPPNQQRPDDGSCAWDSTAAVLPSGELLTMGGCSETGPHVRRVDMYDPQTDSWRNFETLLPRRTPSSVLLPDGSVLLMNGENPLINQSEPQTAAALGDPRVPVIFNPQTGSVLFLKPEPEQVPAFRGYHNMVVLLKDGRILTGGGVHKRGDIGCEQPTFRLFTPPYLLTGKPRPVFLSGHLPEPIVFTPGSYTVIRVSGRLRSKGGVVLLAAGSFTHAYDQNQRYVELTATSDSVTDVQNLVVLAPAVPDALYTEYVMYLISEDGVPSVGVHARVVQRSSALRRTESIGTLAVLVAIGGLLLQMISA